MSVERTHNTATLKVRLPFELLNETYRHCQDRCEPLSSWVRGALRQQLSRDRLTRRQAEIRAAFRDQVFIETTNQE